LFGFGKNKDKKKVEKVAIKDLKTMEEIEAAIGNIKKDNFVEKMFRGEAAKSAAVWLYYAYDIYKKAHAMASSPEDFDTHDAEEIDDYAEGGNVGFGGAFKGRDSN